MKNSKMKYLRYMKSNKENLRKQFDQSVAKYKHSMRYSRKEKSLMRRALYGLTEFGFSYVLYSFSRFKIPVLFGDIRVPLFYGESILLPSTDIGTHTLSLYGIIPHSSERRLSLWIVNNIGDSEIFYDIGAHLGFYTALAQYLIEKGEVHAFEANRGLASYLNKNFGDSENAHIIPFAVAAQAGEIDFYDATDTEDSSASSRFNIVGMKEKPSKVMAITLDEYVESGNTAPTVMKLDIEGGEYDAILGAQRLIQKNRPLIILEVWGGDMGEKYSANAVKKLQELGYEAYAFMGDGSVSTKPIQDPVGSIPPDYIGSRDNFIFIPQAVL